MSNRRCDNKSKSLECSEEAARSQGMQVAPGAETDKETDSLGNFQRNQPCQYLDFSSVRFILDL